MEGRTGIRWGSEEAGARPTGEGSGGVESYLDGLGGVEVPVVWGDDELAEGLGELTQEVSEGAEEFVEGAQETAFGHQLVDGVDCLEEVVKGFHHPRV